MTTSLGMMTSSQSIVVLTPEICSRFSGLRIPVSVTRKGRSPRFSFLEAVDLRVRLKRPLIFTRHMDSAQPGKKVGRYSNTGSGLTGVGFGNFDEPEGWSSEARVQDKVRGEDECESQSRGPDHDGKLDGKLPGVMINAETIESTNSLAEDELLYSNYGALQEMIRLIGSVSESLVSVLKQHEISPREGEASVKGRSGDIENITTIDTSVTTQKISVENKVSFKRREETRKRQRRTNTERILNGKGNVALGKVGNDSKGIEDEDERFMFEALVEARKAAKAGEVPVGAVIVLDGKIISRAYNRVEAEGDPTAHAEMLCIRNAAKQLGNWRLMEATMYVTLEPCPMCAGAILQSRVKEVVWGARNTLLGADGSWVSLFPDAVDDEILGDRPKAEIEPRMRPLVHPFHTSLEVRRE